MQYLQIQQIELMKAVISSRLCTAQRRNKPNSNKKERRELAFNVSDYVFIDPFQLADISSNAADEIASPRYNKIVQRPFGPYQVFRAQYWTDTMEEDGIPNTISLDHIALSPSENQLTET